MSSQSNTAEGTAESLVWGYYGESGRLYGVSIAGVMLTPRDARAVYEQLGRFVTENSRAC